MTLLQAARSIQRFFRSDWNKRLLIKVSRMNLMLKKQEELALKRKLKRSLKKAAALGAIAKVEKK